MVCDLDGVLYLGDEAIAGAGEALARLERAGFDLLFVTNNSTRTQTAAARKVALLTGYAATADQVLGSATATVALLSGRVDTAFVVGEEGLAATLRDGGIAVTRSWQDADVVVVGLDRHACFDVLRDASLAVRAGARFVATNVDHTYPTPEGQVPGCGALVAFIAAAAAQEPEVAGKPFPAMRALVRNAVGGGPAYVVGDRPDTDLEMGRLEGWPRVLVLSGVTADAGGLDGDDRPELVIDSIADLPDRIDELAPSSAASS